MEVTICGDAVPTSDCNEGIESGWPAKDLTPSPFAGRQKYACVDENSYTARSEFGEVVGSSPRQNYGSVREQDCRYSFEKVSLYKRTRMARAKNQI